MRSFALLPLSALLVTLIASAPAASAQSASFIVSQHGKSVGKASFNFTASSSGYDSTALVIINMKGLDYSLSKTERLSPANHLRHVQLSAAVNGSAVNIPPIQIRYQASPRSSSTSPPTATPPPQACPRTLLLFSSPTSTPAHWKPSWPSP